MAGAGRVGALLEAGGGPGGVGGGGVRGSRVLVPRGAMAGAGRVGALLEAGVAQVVRDGGDIGDPPPGGDVVARLPLAGELFGDRHRRRIGGYPPGALRRRTWSRCRVGPWS